MPKLRNVAVLVGSLRKESFSRKIARAIAEVAPATLKLDIVDVGSRPYGQSAWSGKPGAVVSVSPGAIGGFGANHHLRQSLVFLDVPVMQQPEAYVSGVADLLDAGGRLTNDGTRELLRKFAQAFAAWIEATARH